MMTTLEREEGAELRTANHGARVTASSASGDPAVRREDERVAIPGTTRTNLRVCIVVPYDLADEGGVKSHAYQLADALRAAGDEVRIAGPLREGQTEPEVRGFGGVVNIPANGAANYMALLTPPWEVAQFLRAGRFDVVHLHEPMVPLLPWYALWFSGGAAHVATFHMYAESEGLASHAARAVLARALFPSLDAGIAVSQAAAEYAARYWKRPLPIIPNGTSTAAFHPPLAETPRSPADPLRLLFVGNWRDSRKGLPVLIEAHRMLHGRGIPATLDVIGQGTPDLERRSIPGITFHGVVDVSVMARHYRSCDLFVSPATGQESFGIVLLEAMASGRPIICSDIRGYRELVDDHGCVLVPPRNATALADAIADLARSPERRRAMGAWNRRRAEEYDWNPVGARVREVYLDALAARHGGRDARADASTVNARRIRMLD
jgi:phosphatidylinositol alpha-mannosyltransferase